MSKRPSPLQKLTIAHLRGAVEPFELLFESKNLTIIYGENGTGKSTICDALEFLGKGRVGSLDNRGLGKTTPYWNTVSKTTADVAVTLYTANGTCHGTIVKGEVVAQPPDTRPRVEVLRRSQILTLLEARPGERYEEIRRFIDVSGIEDSENTLRRLIAELDNSRNTAVARIGENLETIEQFWEAAGKPGTSAMVWAETEAARDPSVADPELVALRSLQNAYTRLGGYPDQLRALEEELRAAQQEADAAQQYASETLQQIAQHAGAIVGVLQAAQSYLHSQPTPDRCPLCESGTAVAGLVERIEQRLEQFAAYERVQVAQQAAGNAVQRAKQRHASLLERFQQDTLAFEQARAAYPWSADIQLPATAIPHAVDALADWLSATAQLPESWNRADAARQDQRQFLTTLKSALATYTKNYQGQQEMDLLLPRLRRALEIVVEERKTFSDAVLQKIASEVGRLYDAVHPGEGLNAISLQLDTKRRASLDIGTRFGGHTNTPPQAYFSQSHLDTLGICVFLALAMLDDPANTVLVLDDVLASVDEPHVDRLIDMLYSEVSKFRHCVITTHYGPWRHKYKWGWLKNGQCHFVELSRWTATGGITTIRHMPDVERLKNLLAESPPDPQLVCAKAGVVLEAALDFLTQLYECSVPRKQEPRYTLGELLPAIKGKLRKTLKVEIYSGNAAPGAPPDHTIFLEPILNELDRIAQTRNVIGCHFNAIAFDLLDTDALVFGRKALELIDALADPMAGWPRNSKSGSYWANAGETRRLYPLKHPS